MKKDYYQNYLAEDEVVMITGSLNCNKDDRYLSRKDIHPVQLLIDNKVIPVPFFDSWGEYGASSFAWDKDKNDYIYFTTGETPYKIDLLTKQYKSMNIDRLKDVHEIEIINGKLWLSNTGNDEAIAIDISKETVSKRVSLKMLKENNEININVNTKPELNKVEKFHCNQITTGYSGELWALVHHTSGEQIIRKVANKLIKNQGNGGVIDLNTGNFIDLKLKSPHSIRKIKSNYWVFDSGNSKAHIYSPSWELIKKVDTAGFARGADISKNGVVCAGISETRKRYLNIIKGGKKVPNMLQFFSGLTADVIDEVEIPDIEQINNVYVIDRQMSEQLLALH